MSDINTCVHGSSSSDCREWIPPDLVNTFDHRGFFPSNGREFPQRSVERVPDGEGPSNLEMVFCDHCFRCRINRCSIITTTHKQDGRSWGRSACCTTRGGSYRNSGGLHGPGRDHPVESSHDIAAGRPQTTGHQCRETAATGCCPEGRDRIPAIRGTGSNAPDKSERIKV